MKRKLVKVTQRCINRGRRGNSYYCPIALAVNNQKMIEGNVSVQESIIEVPGSIRQWVSLPRSARRFVKKFDRLGPGFVQPFNFYLELNESKLN